MSPRLLFAYLVLSLLEPLLAFAKPPDLPRNMQVDCRHHGRQSPHAVQGPPQYIPPPPNYPLPRETASLEEAIAQQPALVPQQPEEGQPQETSEECCPCLDGCCVGFIEMVGEILQALAGNQAEEAEANESEVLEVLPKEAQAQEPEKLSLSPRHAQAKHLYRIGERCRRRGDMDMARNCYQEVCRLTPKSPYGLLAAGQLLRMQGQTIQQTGASEAQEPPLDASEEEALIEELYRMADQLRKQTHAEPVCPFRRSDSPVCPIPRTDPSAPDKPQTDDQQSMSDAEMQEMLESAQFLDTILDDMVIPDGDHEMPLAVRSGRKGTPEELTVAPAPRELTIEEEPRQTEKPAARKRRPSEDRRTNTDPR